MTQAENIKKLMRLYRVTYAELGKELGRSPATVKQRLNTESTFHKYFEEYKKALERCVTNKEREREKEWERLA